MWISRVNNFLLGKIPCSCPLWPPRRVAVEERRGGGVAEQWRRLPDDGVVQRWRGAVTASGDGEPVALPVALSPPLSIGLGFEVGSCGSSSEPRVLSYLSPPFLYRAAQRGPTSLFLGWAPDQGARSRD